MSTDLSRKLEQVFSSLLACHGLQHWWPAQSPFEVMVGAILTQNTNWTNVEKAIANLEAQDCLDVVAILNCDDAELAGMLRPSGYFNIKAKRLKSFCHWYQESGGYEALKTWETTKLRKALLAVHGVGPETADDMLLYAFNRPVFVVDAYTQRLFTRLGLIEEGLGYESVRSLLEGLLSPDVSMLNEYHALIVNHGKDFCRPRPRCAECCLKADCQYGYLAGTESP